MLDVPSGPAERTQFAYSTTSLRRRANSGWSACLVRARDDDWLYPASSPRPRGGRGTWLQCSVVTAKQGGSCYTLPLSLSLLPDLRHPLISNSALSSFYVYVHNSLLSLTFAYIPIFILFVPSSIKAPSINIVPPLHTSQLRFFFPSSIILFLFFSFSVHIIFFVLSATKFTSMGIAVLSTNYPPSFHWL